MAECSYFWQGLYFNTGLPVLNEPRSINEPASINEPRRFVDTCRISGSALIQISARYLARTSYRVVKNTSQFLSTAFLLSSSNTSN